MAKNLILFSGGMDTTYLTYKFLVDTSDEITLLILWGGQQFYASSVIKEVVFSMQPILKELKKYRDFKVIYHKVDRTKITSWDLDIHYAYATKAFADDFTNGTYDNLITGISWESHDGQYFKHSLVQGFSTTIAATKHPTKGFTRGRHWAPLLTQDIHLNYNRWHVHKYLPEDLKSLVFNVPTAQDKLHFDIAVKSFIAKGWTASDLDDWRRIKAREYGGGSRDISYHQWFPIHMGLGIITRPGVAIDDTVIRYLKPHVTTKEECIEWYTNIEYNVGTDSRLIKWNLTKEAYNPDE